MRRVIEITTIEEINDRDVKFGDGWSCMPPDEVFPLLSVGKEVELELLNFRIVGWRIDGEWVYRLTDEELQRERDDFIEKKNKERRRHLDENRERFEKETAELPDWIRPRIEYFYEKAGEKFALLGWGYELVVAQLAVLLEESKLEETEKIQEFNTKQGVSGNQYDMARALARAHVETPDFDFAGTISALSPITGSAYYE